MQKRYQGGFLENQYATEGLEWYRNGHLAYKGYYMDGTKHGHGTSWNEEGFRV